MRDDVLVRMRPSGVDSDEARRLVRARDADYYAESEAAAYGAQETTSARMPRAEGDRGRKRA